MIRWFEIQPPDLGHVERLYTGSNALRPRQCLCDRCAHVGRAELRQQGTVYVSDQRVHQTLRVHHHVDLRLGQAEQQRRLDDLEPFVHERGGVDRDLAAHFPLGVIACFIGRDMRQPRQFHRTKWPSGRGQDQARHAASHVAGQIVRRHALENRVVFAVDRDDFGAGAVHLIHEQLAGHHQRFLIGEQHSLGRAHCGQGRQEAGGADDGRHDHMHVVAGHC